MAPEAFFNINMVSALFNQGNYKRNLVRVNMDNFLVPLPSTGID